MKNIFLTCILLLGLTDVKAQGYESIVGLNSTQWNIAIEVLDAGYHTQSFTVGDTVTINSQLYRKIIRDNYDTTQYLIREDTVTGKAWIFNGDTETLISDMELSIGDSILIGNEAIGTVSLNYGIVDSVYFADNRKHIRLNQAIYYDPQRRVELIEGVGPNSGFLQSVSTQLDFNHRLVCAHKDGILTFADSALFDPEPCLYNPVGLEEDLKKAEIKVYPNPSSDLITFALDNYLNERVTITLLDRLGRTVQEVTSTLNNPVVNTAEMPNGIYFYRLSVNGKSLASGKISVSN